MKTPRRPRVRYATGLRLAGQLVRVGTWFYACDCGRQEGGFISAMRARRAADAHAAIHVRGDGLQAAVRAGDVAGNGGRP